MKLLFVADPLETFKTYKDTTYAMMRAAQARGHEVHACEARELQWSRGGHVVARIRQIELVDPAPQGDAHGHAEWFRVRHDSGVRAPLPLMRFDAVVMRKDPPFDNEYFYATHLLEQAEREGAKVFNRPSALRNHPEKLSILEFPQFITPTLVSRDADALKAFHVEHHDVIFKPLDGMGGAGIFRVGPDGLNLGAIVETLNAFGRHTVMAQRYLPEIVHGDKRILLIGGVPVQHALARIPQGSEIRGNLAAGGKGVAQPLTGRDRQIAEHLGPVLAARGLLLVGLDVIGSCLTEINVTSPTGFQEIMKQTGFDVAGMFIGAVEAAVAPQASAPTRP